MWQSIKLLLCTAVVVLIAFDHTAAAGPTYHPGVKSYFDLVVFHPSFRVTWLEAKRQAKLSTYKGTRGRLAIVSRDDVNDFLKESFAPTQEAWIGLRYRCPYPKLQWVSGAALDRGEYSNWHPYWFRDPTSHCAVTDMPFMPVYYTPIEGGFLWQASSTDMRLSAFFIEYPTGER